MEIGLQVMEERARNLEINVNVVGQNKYLIYLYYMDFVFNPSCILIVPNISERLAGTDLFKKI